MTTAAGHEQPHQHSSCGMTHCSVCPRRWSRCAQSTRNRRSCSSTWHPSRRCRRGSATRREPSSSLRAAQRSHMRPWCWTACFAWREVLLGISPRPCSLFAAASTVKNLFVSRVQVKTVTFLAKTLEDAGFRVATLHGERSQPEREVSQNVPVMRPQGRISRCCRPSNLLWTQRGSLSC